MNCPACASARLSLTDLEARLSAYGCEACGGRWLAATDYRSWLERQPARPAVARAPGEAVKVADVQHARLCPNCSRIMLRYQVGHGVEMVLDICGSCQGIWLDRNEWQTLKARGLHDDLHLVSSEPWQAEVRREETREHLDALYRKRFGTEYQRIQRLRTWLGEHPQREAIFAYLLDRDPLTA